MLNACLLKLTTRQGWRLARPPCSSLTSCNPQRGAEQDSHEALRVLLDGLDTEEHKRLRLDARPAEEAAGGMDPGEDLCHGLWN